MSNSSQEQRMLYVVYRKMCYKHLHEVLTELTIPYAIIKGEALSYQIYARPDMRTSSDIDILVSRNNIHIVENLLCKAGFQSTQKQRSDRIVMLSGSHQVSTWIKEIRPLGYINVDLNFDIFWGEYEGERCNMDDFLSDTVELEIYGTPVRTLPVSKAMIQLILHHYKEMNSIYHLATHNCMTPAMFTDVFNLWKHNRQILTDNVFLRLCAKYAIQPYAYYILYYTNRLFPAPELTALVSKLKTADGEKLLDSFGLDARERKQWTVGFETRLRTENMYELIEAQLTEADFKKLERNRRIFG